MTVDGGRGVCVCVCVWGVWSLGTRLALKGEVHRHLEVRGKELNLWVWG